MVECIDPRQIQEGDLLAYVEGAASAEIKQHVRRCPFCARQAAILRLANLSLTRAFYRLGCPGGETLALYQMNLLSSADQLVVAAHIRNCPACTQEMRTELVSEESWARQALNLLQKALRVLEIQPLMPPTVPQQAWRGTENPPQTFEGPTWKILLEFQPQEAGNSGALVGAIEPQNAALGSRIWLIQEGTTLAETEVDQFGSFVFESIAPGRYDMVLDGQETAWVLREIIIHPPHGS